VKISTKFLATIIEARLDEITQSIFDAIDNLPFALDAGIVITGGGAKLSGIIEFIAEKTGIYARFGDHSEWLADNTPERYHDPKYAQLIGTILLTNEYRKAHPVEVAVNIPGKEPKIPRKKLRDKIADGFINFFNDDNKLN